MKIAIVTPKIPPPTQAHGGDKSVLLLADQLSKTNAVTLVSEECNGEVPDDIIVAECPMEARELKRVLKGHDIVHVYNNGPALITARAASQKLGIPAVATANSYWATCLWADMTFPDGHACLQCSHQGLHKDYETRDPATIGTRVHPFFARMEVSHRTNWLSAYDLVIALSHSSAMRLKSAGVSPSRMVVIPNMAEPWMFTQPLPEPAEAPNILYVGQLKHGKGVEYIVRAMPLIHKTIPKATLNIIGVGPQDGHLRLLAENLSVDDSVHLWGYMREPELSKHWQQAMVLAFPTIWPEPFGRAVLETWAHGVPPIVGNGGPAEVVDNTITGWTLSPWPHPKEVDSVRALADLTVSAMLDFDGREKMRMEGRAALQRYHPDVILPKLLALYSDLVRRAGGGL